MTNNLIANTQLLMCEEKKKTYCCSSHNHLLETNPSMTAFDDYYQTTFTNSVENLSFSYKKNPISKG